MNMEKNKKILWGVVAVILLLVAFALGRESGWQAGTADVLNAIYPPTDPYANYVPFDEPIYEPAYLPTDYVYPPTL